MAQVTELNAQILELQLTAIAWKHVPGNLWQSLWLFYIFLAPRGLLWYSGTCGWQNTILTLIGQIIQCYLGFNLVLAFVWVLPHLLVLCLMCCRRNQESHPSTTISARTSLPPHQPYDSVLFRYSKALLWMHFLSSPERQFMDRCIKDSLETSLICPSSSLARAGFFFAKKKDGSLQPCIDYSGLNDISVKNMHPLSLISSAFEL